METTAYEPRRLVFLLVATGVFLSTMDSSMINVALPSIMRSFSTTLAMAEWVVMIYLLTITVSLLIWGYLADRYGQGWIYLQGMLIFTCGSGFCSFVPTLSLLIFFRFVQALGAAMMMSAGPAIIKTVFPKEHLGRSLGFLGIATSIGLMSGPVISGFLIHYFSWRAIFLITVPVSLSVFVMGWIFLLPVLRKSELLYAPGFDWRGSLLWTILVSLVVFFISQVDQAGSIEKALFGLLFVITARWFWLAESRRAVPLLPLFLLRRKNYRLAMITSSISFIVLFIILIIMPFYMDFVLHMPVNIMGYVMMAVPLTLFVVSPAAGWLYDRIGSGFLTTTGLAVCCLAVLLLCFLKPESTPIDIAWRLALLGTGQSLFLSPNSASVLGTVEKEYSGITSGMLATSRNIGMLLGVSIAGMIFTQFFSHFSGGHDLKEFPAGQITAFMNALKSTLGIAALLALIGGILSALRE